MSDNPVKMYILINSDLNMTAGKIASQACHITHRIVEELVRNGYEQFPPSNEYMTYMKWSKNCIKIIVKATNDQLLELLKNPMARAFYDGGNTTQVEVNSLTAIGFLPSGDLDKLMDGYKLL